jgi:DNA mismatch repair protein MutS
VPKPVITKARQRLQELETHAHLHAEHLQSQLPLFDPIVPEPQPSEVETMLSQLNPDELTPREALEQLYLLKQHLNQ